MIRERIADFYDLKDNGYVELLSHWTLIDYNEWEAEVEALVSGKWAEELGVPHDTYLRGVLWVKIKEEGYPDRVEWEEYRLNDWTIVRLSESLISDLASAILDILGEKNINFGKVIKDQALCREVLKQAWQTVRKEEIWKNLNKMLKNIDQEAISRIEDLALSNVDLTLLRESERYKMGNFYRD